jgi:hypothetical protein
MHAINFACANNWKSATNVMSVMVRRRGEIKHIETADGAQFVCIDSTLNSIQKET